MMGRVVLGEAISSRISTWTPLISEAQRKSESQRSLDAGLLDVDEVGVFRCPTTICYQKDLEDDDQNGRQLRRVLRSEGRTWQMCFSTA